MSWSVTVLVCSRCILCRGKSDLRARGGQQALIICDWIINGRWICAIATSSKVRKVNKEWEGTSCAGNSSFDKLADRR